VSDAEKTVFISYRRNVSSFIARAIFLDLREHGYDVFMDVESIDSGQFDTIILNQIAARAHFLVILTPGSVERCAEPDDWLRREIEFAMDLQRNIVPVLVSNFSFSEKEAYLTGKLSELRRYNGLSLPHDYFDAAMERLRNRFLKRPVYGAIQPTPPAERPEVQRRVAEVARQPVPSPDSLAAEQHIDQAEECYSKEDYEGAAAHCTLAIRLNPQYGIAYYNRGNIRYDQGDYAGAIADYSEAIRLDPQDAMAYNNRGLVRDHSGDCAGAITDYSEAIRLSPQDAAAYNNPRQARQHMEGHLRERHGHSEDHVVALN